MISYFKRNWLGLTVLVGAAGLLLIFLGRNALVNWDEAWFASVSADMVRRGDWLGGQWNGEVWFYEPPFLTWVLALVMTLFGDHEFGLRLFNAASGFGCILLVLAMTRRLTKHKLAPLLSAIVLVADIEFLFRARQINTDVPLTLFMLIALYGLMRVDRLSLWLMGWGAWGLAFLTKRATGALLLPVAMYIFWRVRKRGYGKRWFWGVGVLLLITAPWYVYMWQGFGQEFINKFFLGYTLDKLKSVNPATGADLVYYIKSIGYAFRYWALVLPLAGVWLLKQFRANWKWRVILIYILTIGLVLTLIPIKASWYLLPIHPAIAVVLGSFAAGAIAKLGRFKLVVIAGVVVVTLGQLWQWRNDYVVPETTRNQANMAKFAGSLITDQKIYLDDDWLPVAVFYSGKTVVPLRFNRERVDTSLPLKLESGAFILTNSETVEDLKQRATHTLTSVALRQDLLLFRVD